MKIDPINPIVPIQIRGEVIEVKELDWKTYTFAVQRMTASILKVVSEKGQLVLTTEKVVEFLADQEELLSILIKKSTGRPDDWVNSLSAREVMPVVQAIVQLNLTEALISAGKEVAGQISKAFGLKMKSPELSISSSAPATP